MRSQQGSCAKDGVSFSERTSARRVRPRGRGLPHTDAFFMQAFRALAVLSSGFFRD